MLFTLLDFGPLSGLVQKYADLDGAIPTPGDRWQDYHWATSIRQTFADKAEGRDRWHTFLQDAAVEINKAWEEFEALHDTR